MDDKGMNVDQAQKCEKCGMVVKDGKCAGCDQDPKNCTCTVKTEEAQ